MVTIAVCFIRYRRPNTLSPFWFVICVWAGLLFLGVWSWSPFKTRFHLCFFLLWSAPVGLVLSRVRYRFIAYIILLWLMYYGIYCLAVGQPRPLLGNESIFTRAHSAQYFTKCPHLQSPYRLITSALLTQKIDHVGILCNTCGIEYPLWALLQKHQHVARIDHVMVKNRSKTTAKNTSLPPVVLSLQQRIKGATTIGKERYHEVYSAGTISMLVHEDELRRARENGSAYDALFRTLTKESELLINGNFADGLTGWMPWRAAAVHSNDISVVSAAGKVFGARHALRIENPRAELTGIQQLVRVESGVTYRLSAHVRSVATSDSKKIFGGRIAVYLPPQPEHELIWMSEHNKWWRKECIFDNRVSGVACIYVHLGYGNIATTGLFSAISLEPLAP